MEPGGVVTLYRVVFERELDDLRVHGGFRIPDHGEAMETKLFCRDRQGAEYYLDRLAPFESSPGVLVEVLVGRPIVDQLSLVTTDGQRAAAVEEEKLDWFNGVSEIRIQEGV